MNANLSANSHGSSGSLLRRVASVPKRIAARREHDAAMMSDPRIAAEHTSQVARATSHGQPGCEFCS